MVIVSYYGKQDKAFNFGFFVFTYVKEVYSIIIYELIIHTLKKENKPPLGAISQIVHWEIGKNSFFHFWLVYKEKEQGLSQNKLIKISMNK